MDLLISLGCFAFFLLLGLFVGGYRERSHFARLDQRERALSDMLVTQLKSFPSAVTGESPPTLLVAEAVIGTDYLKSFLAGLRNIFGGEIRSYQTLLVRARREALLRVMEQAESRGYNAVCNVRFSMADIGGNTGSQKKVAIAALMASGTAYHADHPV